MSERRKMGAGDWMDASINVVIGVFIGSVIYGLAQLIASGSWLMAMILILLGGGLILITVLSDKLLDRLIPKLDSTSQKTATAVAKTTPAGSQSALGLHARCRAGGPGPGRNDSWSLNLSFSTTAIGRFRLYPALKFVLILWQLNTGPSSHVVVYSG